ncbi:MAG: CoA transferase, partial [Rhodospirillaceae bacterium]|nr:CoA transferase [Rhodospirillaceae bacterium]
VEPPEMPDMMRDEGADPELAEQGLGSGFVCQAGGKRSLVLDLGKPDGIRAALKLVEGADVLVENYRKGTLERLGLGYDVVRKARPDIIYCSLTGFGQTGPKAEHPAYDPVIQAYSGLMAANGTTEINPVRVGPPAIDYGTGAQAAFAIASALFHRARTGEGQRIDVAMADAALMMMSMPVMATQVLGRTPVPFGNETPGKPAYSCHDTADGLLFIGAATQRQVVRTWRALGEAAIADEREAMTRAELDAVAEPDRARLAGILLDWPADYWEQCLNDAGVPAARVRRIDEALAEEQTATRGVMAQSELQSGGRTLSFPVAAFGFEHGGPALSGPPPRHGQHSREVLAEAGFSAEEIEGLVASGTVG